MALKFETKRVTIPLGKGNRSIEDQKPLNVTTITSAQVAVQGFKLQFREGDNPVKLVEAGVLLSADPAGKDEVEFRVVCQYQDKTGNDEYSGHVDVLIIADAV
jgi:hypothetical protein